MRKAAHLGGGGGLSVGNQVLHKIGRDGLPSRLSTRARAGAGQGAFHPSCRGSDPLLVHLFLIPARANQVQPRASIPSPPMSFGLQRKRSLAFQGQLALPLDYSRSEPAAPSHSPAPSKGSRRLRRQARLAPNPASHGPLGSAPVSSEGDTKERRPRQRFVLTPTVSTLITQVNGKRWPHVVSLPPLQSRKEPELRDCLTTLTRTA